MAKNEKTGKGVASLAGKGLKNPKSVTQKQQKRVFASALAQTEDKKGRKKPKS
jgi:hypothetical protein